MNDSEILCVKSPLRAATARSLDTTGRVGGSRDRFSVTRRMPLRGTVTATIAASLVALAVHLSVPAIAAPPATTGRPSASEQSKAQVTIVTADEIHVGDGTVLRDAQIEVQGDRIVYVGPRRDGPAGAQRRTLTAGKRIVPGFIAAHSQLGLVEIEMEGSTVDASRDGGGAVRAGYDPALAINSESPLLPIQAIEGITSAAVTPVGGLLAGSVTLIDLVPDAAGSLIVRERVAIAGTLGQSVHGSRAESLHQLRRVLTDAADYRRNKGAYDRNQMRSLLAHPVDLEALYPVLDRKVRLVLEADRKSDILAALKLAADLKINIAIAGAAQGWMVGPQLAAQGVPVLIMPSKNLPTDMSRVGARLDNAALMAADGVKLVIADLGGAHNVRNIKQEAGIAIAYGLDPQQALAAITSNVADLYGVADRVGTLAKGKEANFIVFGGDPFELSSFPEEVWIHGRPIEMTSRQTLLRDRYRLPAEPTVTVHPAIAGATP